MPGNHRRSPPRTSGAAAASTPSHENSKEKMETFIDAWISGIDFMPPPDSAYPEPPRVVPQQVMEFRRHLVDALAKHSSVQTLEDFVELVRAPFLIFLIVILHSLLMRHLAGSGPLPLRPAVQVHG